MDVALLNPYINLRLWVLCGNVDGVSTLSSKSLNLFNKIVRGLFSNLDFSVLFLPKIS